ncbi:MAG: formate C-acetyltransferase/glycerol dehydratase family glycyl radical enzyme [Archaeoglobaceae archaeon]|nr:formate C-acetyltransferase/glycerol dehydratase family glycyl radical enzyme [Archaeoglobaceae archaeon]
MDRIERLKERFIGKKPKIYIDRAKFYTEAMKSNEGEPIIIRQAKALKHVLENIPVIIFPDELIVGAMVKDPPSAIMYPEGVGLRILPEIENVYKRENNPLEISKEDIEIVRNEIAPYWMDKSLGAIAEKITPRFCLDLLFRGSFYIATEIAGISHFAVDYPFLLKNGLENIKRFAEKKISEFEELKLTDPSEVEKILFYKAVEIVCEGVINLAKRYAKKAIELANEAEDERREELLKIAEICEWVPAKPPRNFWEALQFVWFMQLALHMESYEQGISMGRIDQYLYPYYKKDLDAGILTFEKAVELVSCLWIKTNEIVPLFDELLTIYFAGLPTNQAVTLGGVDENGKDATNELTFVMLEATRRVAMRQPNVHVRVSGRSPKKLLDKCAELILSGINAISLFNDSLIIDGWLKLGLPIEEARNYSTVGCVELSPPGKSYDSTDAALFNIAICLELALFNGETSMGDKVGVEYGEIRSMEDILNSFRKQLEKLVKCMILTCNCFEVANQLVKPTPLISVCNSDLELGKDITLGSAKYNFSGVQMVGLADVADSLAAIDELVFRKKLISMEELLNALRNNFEGKEELRQILLNKAPKYGRDDIANYYAKLIAEMYAEEVMKYRNPRGGKYLPGIYSMSTHVGFGMLTGALPNGRKSGEPLSNGIAPNPSTKSLTSAMRAVASIDHRLFMNGISYVITISPEIFRGFEGIEKFKSLLMGYFSLGGMNCHFNVVDATKLIEAQKNPEKYRDLLVRVAGFSAYFVDLTKEVQDEIIRKYLENV